MSALDALMRAAGGAMARGGRAAAAAGRSPMIGPGAGFGALLGGLTGVGVGATTPEPDMLQNVIGGAAAGAAGGGALGALAKLGRMGAAGAGEMMAGGGGGGAMGALSRAASGRTPPFGGESLSNLPIGKIFAAIGEDVNRVSTHELDLVSKVLEEQGPQAALKVASELKGILRGAGINQPGMMGMNEFGPIAEAYMRGAPDEAKQLAQSMAPRFQGY